MPNQMQLKIVIVSEQQAVVFLTALISIRHFSHSFFSFILSLKAMDKKYLRRFFKCDRKYITKCICIYLYEMADSKANAVFSDCSAVTHPHTFISLLYFHIFMPSTE